MKVAASRLRGIGSQRDFFTSHRLPIPIQYQRRTLYVFLALLSPVRVYKPLRVHLLSILIEIRFFPLRLLSVPFKQRIGQNATVFSCLLSLTHFVISCPGTTDVPSFPHSLVPQSSASARGPTPICPHLFQVITLRRM